MGKRSGLMLITAMIMAMNVSAGCSGKATSRRPPPPPDPRPRAIIKTRFGEMELKLYPDLALSTSRISSNWRSPASITGQFSIASFQAL